MRFRNLGSGSTGNSTVVEGRDGGTVRRLLIDCGFGPRKLQQRLALAGLCYADIDAIFITHEHSDHVGCVAVVAQRHQIPVWMSAGTHAAMGSPSLGPLLHLVRDGDSINLGAFEARPFTVPHDAREPLQLRCSNGAHHLGIATDLGHATSHVLEQLSGCHALLLESNHDPELLSRSAYPPFLQRRISGPYGHLSNRAAADILGRLRHDTLGQVVAAHLSERNNHPDLVKALFADAAGQADEDIVVADPITGTEWLAVFR